MMDEAISLTLEGYGAGLKSEYQDRLIRENAKLEYIILLILIQCEYLQRVQ